MARDLQGKGLVAVGIVPPPLLRVVRMRGDCRMPEKSAIEQVEHLVQNNSGSPKSGDTGATRRCCRKGGSSRDEGFLIPKRRAQENHVRMEAWNCECVGAGCALLAGRSAGKTTTPKMRHTSMKCLRNLPQPMGYDGTGLLVVRPGDRTRGVVAE